MQRQPVQEQLSLKSRGILYNLRSNLVNHKKTLEGFICELFGYLKQKFSKKQFQKLIKNYDENLIYEETDKLFDQLDQNKNGFVFLYRLKEVYNSLTEADNLKQIPKSVFTAKIFNLVNDINPNIQQTIEQIRVQLLSLQQLYEVIDLFMIDQHGFLTVSNVIELFKSIDFSNEKKRKLILSYLFENKNKISMDCFIKKMKLENACKRLNMSRIKQKQEQEEKSVFEMDEQRSQHGEENLLQSKFVKENIRESIRLQESVSLDLKSIKSEEEFVSIEKIPQVLESYFNYGSVLQPEFARKASQFIGRGQLFIDYENPNYSKAHKWIHYSQIKGNNYTLFQVNQSVIFRQKNRKGLGQLLQSKDIIQGRLGDCYFLSAISAIVQRYPELVYRLFVLDKNPSHIYGVRLFNDGKWKTIIVDACFPFAADNRLCAAKSYKDQIWVMLLEKAWAKMYGSFDNIHSGYNQEGLNALSGAPSIPCSSREEGFLRKLQAHLKKGSIITCATSAQVQQMTDQQQDNLGIYSNHAYTLLSVHSNLPYKDRTITLLRIRNPWGRKQWKGEWSYYSSFWTKQLKDSLNYNNNPEDGSFYMDYHNFTVYFDFVNICRINLSYLNSYLTFEADRNEFYVLKVRIRQKGDYFFTQYQQNPRKYKNSMNYKKSKSWMFLSKIQEGDKRHAIGSNAQQYKDNTLEVSLQPGEYILVTKITWKFWQTHEQTIASYGPQKVDFRLDKSKKYNPELQLSKFIESKGGLGLGKMSTYENMNISKQMYFDPVQGYGLIEIMNMENKILNSIITMKGCKGLEILPPFQLPIKLTIFPSQTIIVKFIVDPAGYAYQYSESYYMQRIQ